MEADIRKRASLGPCGCRPNDHRGPSGSYIDPPRGSGQERQLEVLVSLETIVIVVVIVLIVLFVLGFIGRGRMGR